MNRFSTEAWVLSAGEDPKNPHPGQLQRETFSFDPISAEEVLLEPIIGCWEANMSHALLRKPVDICRQRREEKIVLGNSGVGRVLKTGSEVTTVKEGDLCVIFGVAKYDKHGYPTLIYAYDAPGTMGILAKQIKIHQRSIIPIPKESKYSLQQWAAFSLRYFSAWSSWEVAFPVWQVQMKHMPLEEAIVAAWGGGVSLAELALAKHHGFKTLMVASTDERLKLIEKMGIGAIDRRKFAGLKYDDQAYMTNREYREGYIASERIFLGIINQYTHGEGVDIFIDNIGLPVFRATLRALARQGVVTTSGWKQGMELSVLRAIECIKRHIHVFTHGALYPEGIEAVNFAEEHAWIPPHSEAIYAWEDIPQLADDYANAKIDSYFPLYAINI